MREECEKIQAKAGEVSSHLDQAGRAMRQLRRLQVVCLNCPDQADCAILQQINNRILAALAVVGEEWAAYG